MKILTIIPARGGSKGIPKKNVRMLLGKPLISYAISNALNSKHDMDICVSTDDTEIAQVAKIHKVDVVERKAELSTDEVTLDPVIYDAYIQTSLLKNKQYDLIITLQPTSPLLTTKVLDEAIDEMVEKPHIDSLLSAVNMPHLSWSLDSNNEYIQNYNERLNRQFLPEHFVETGAFFITRAKSITRTSRLGQNVSIFEVPAEQSIDIDTPQDWWIAETELSKKSVIIRVEGDSLIGLGHVYRGLSIAYRLINHKIHFVVSQKSDIAIEKLNNSFFPYTIIKNDDEIEKVIKAVEADIIINDMLDTSYHYIKRLKELNLRVINFEDLGEGSKLADAVINDLYAEQKMGHNYFWGSDYYILRDEFLISAPSQFKESVENILIVFGGVDPNNLTKKIFDIIPKIKNASLINFTIIVGPGYSNYDELKKESKLLPFKISVIRDVKNMSDYMRKADLAISSQGRTMLELASMGVPTILMAQNERELTHEFGYLSNGFINLGLGKTLKNDSIISTLNWLISSPQIRKQMNKQMMSKDLRSGTDKVLQIIFDKNN